MEKLIILDYSTLSVDIYDVDTEANIDDEYLENLGHHCSNCSWMFGENVEVVFHKGVLR